MTCEKSSQFPVAVAVAEVRSIWSIALVGALIVLLALLSPLSARAQAVGATTFPRVAVWWPRQDQPTADLAKYDYVALMNTDTDRARIPVLKALNPDIVLLSDGNANEMSYSATSGQSNGHAPGFTMQDIDPDWILYQAWSSSTAAVTASSRTIPVADGTKYRTADLVNIGTEYARVDSVSGNTLTVTRGYAGSTAVAHPTNVAVRPAATAWPNSLRLDMRKAAVQDFQARRELADFHAGAWDGMLIDVAAGSVSYGINTTTCRSYADASGAPLDSAGLATLDANWLTGMTAYLAAVRAGAGNALIFANDAPPQGYPYLNGADFEDFPNDRYPSADSWMQTVFGFPQAGQFGSYTGWASAVQPSLATIQTYQFSGPPPTGWSFATDKPDYRKMRFGLATALMADGYYSFEASTWGHSSLGLYWFDEYDNAGTDKSYLGQPLGAAALALPALSTPDLVSGDGGFENATQLSRWTVETETGYAASKSLDTVTKATGASSGRVAVTAASGTAWKATVKHPVALGTTGSYTLTFRARADRATSVQAWIQKETSPYTAWASFGTLSVDTQWRTYEVACPASGTDLAAMLYLGVGAKTATVWFDDVKVQAGDRTGVYRRDYSGGAALVNPTDHAVTVDLGATFKKIKGTQDPVVNDGSLVTRVTLPARDGIVLVKPTTGGTTPTTPTGDFALAAGASTISTTTVPVASSVTGATQMRFRVAGGAWSAWRAYAAASTVTLPSADGTYAIDAEYVSGDALTLSVSHSIALKLPVVPAPDHAPTGDFSVASQTATTAVQVSSAVTGATTMRLRVAGGAWSGWSAYAPGAAVTLPAVDGTYVIDVEYASAGGLTLACAHSVALTQVIVPAVVPTTTVTLVGPTTSVKSGWAVRLTGRVTRRSSRTPGVLAADSVALAQPTVVVVQVQSASGWTDTGFATIQSDDSFVCDVTPARDSVYRAVLVDTVAGGVTSPPVVVRVTVTLTKPVNSRGAAANRLFWVSGAARPGYRMPLKFTVQKLVGGKWQRYRTVMITTSATGAWRAGLRLAPGYWRVFVGDVDPNHAPSVSLPTGFRLR
jgi:hypothetical protein